LGLHPLFGELGIWPDNLASKPLLLTMNYLVEYDRFVDAVEMAFRSLRRHHALDDAKANRLGWIAGGGDIDREARRVEHVNIAGTFVETAFSAEHVDATIQAECDQPSKSAECPLHETDWWHGVIANANRMAVDEEYRKQIAKDLS